MVLSVDDFPVCYPQLYVGDVAAELAVEQLERHLEVRLAGAPEQRLVGLGVALDREGRVLLLQPGEAGHELVLVALGLGRDGLGERPLRRIEGSVEDGGCLVGDRGADVGVGCGGEGGWPGGRWGWGSWPSGPAPASPCPRAGPWRGRGPPRPW